MNVNAPCRQNNENPTQSIPRHLACAETWAGSDQTASLIELPGLTAWVHSVPVDLSHAGGDVHYVSVCPSCVVSRIALADVSGHGLAVALFGEKLRELMQRYLSFMEQTLDCSSTEALGTRLTSALHAFRGGAEPLDDETIIVMGRNGI